MCRREHTWASHWFSFGIHEPYMQVLAEYFFPVKTMPATSLASQPTSGSGLARETSQQQGYQHVGLMELYPVVNSLWRSDTAVRLATRD